MRKNGQVFVPCLARLKVSLVKICPENVKAVLNCNSIDRTVFVRSDSPFAIHRVYATVPSMLPSVGGSLQ
jgi:hypothetical protein